MQTENLTYRNNGTGLEKIPVSGFSWAFDPPPPWKFQSLPWGGGVWIFSGTTHYKKVQNWYCCYPKKLTGQYCCKLCLKKVGVFFHCSNVMEMQYPPNLATATKTQIFGLHMKAGMVSPTFVTQVLKFYCLSNPEIGFMLSCVLNLLRILWWLLWYTCTYRTCGLWNMLATNTKALNKRIQHHWTLLNTSLLCDVANEVAKRILHLDPT